MEAEELAQREDRPVIAFDCGVDDQLIGHNRRFHEHLDTLDIEHHYAEFGGGHKWEYWSQTLPVVSWTASEIMAMAA